MIPSQTFSAQTIDDPETSPNGGAVRGVRVWFTGTLLALAAAAVLAAGAWGLISSLRAEAPEARIGEPVLVPGGSMRVEGLTPEHMAPMQSGKFAASGMSMSSMGMDMAPEGQRRLAVDVTLTAASGDNLAYSPGDFKIAGKDVNESGPIRHQLEAGTIAEGSSVTGILIFQVPEEAKELKLSFGGGRPVALDVPPVKAGKGHHHGGSSAHDGGTDKHRH